MADVIVTNEIKYYVPFCTYCPYSIKSPSPNDQFLPISARICVQKKSSHNGESLFSISMQQKKKGFLKLYFEILFLTVGLFNSEPIATITRRAIYSLFFKTYSDIGCFNKF